MRRRSFRELPGGLYSSQDVSFANWTCPFLWLLIFSICILQTARQHPALRFDEEKDEIEDDDCYYRDLPGLEAALAALPPTDIFGGVPRPPPTPPIQPDTMTPERRLSNLNPGAGDPAALGINWDAVNGGPSADATKTVAAEDSHVSLSSLGGRVKRVLGMNSFRMRKEDMVKRFFTVPSQRQLDADNGEMLPEQLQDETSFGR